MITVKLINLEELLPLRANILRHGKKPKEVIFPGDENQDTFHVGSFLYGELITIGSFYNESYPYETGYGYRLRSMASVPIHRGKGGGRLLLDFGINKLTSMNVLYLWCNARENAVGFYEKMGLKKITTVFEIPGVGRHFVMKIQF
ncbi:MAG: GNAT family N-acetyltransferase [Ignavibacteriaceae bacterium]|jgi:Acetyltransferase (GNAT) family.|nr:MAG: hypothetical protein UZ04_CHB001001811 [Chlorobi bacterium OLB4]MBW7856051.1 GNAT family N-acetyltransferase [Ignavibacteria bacterium]MEB2329799.1 GNAT family N-acetyltransferase [Ignavibacteriaceae bacterium]OQY77417.1 MAG: hypothetical protein B6D43_07330 [Ignavibacteriales bacterium UTCHB1]